MDETRGVNIARYEAWKRRRSRQKLFRGIVRLVLLLVIFLGTVLAVRSFGRDHSDNLDDYPVNGTVYVVYSPTVYNDDYDDEEETDLTSPTEDVDEDPEPAAIEPPLDLEQIREPIEYCGPANPENAVLITDEQAMSYLALVNNCYRLSRDFTPRDLSPVNVESMHAHGGAHQLRETAARAAEQMFQAAAGDGMFLIATSGFRSYESQTMFHNNAIRDFGLIEARRRSAPPGHSEHQLGLALDLSTHELGGDLRQIFIETPQGMWVTQNAHRFGFILSYPYNREADTGIMYEPWHIRYVGIEVATEIFNNNLILEEFLWYYD